MEGLSLIIPAHNSGLFIEKSLLDYYQFFSSKFENLEIIVVCNDCNDNTAEICKKFSLEFPIKIIEIPQRGKGHAVVNGFEIAKYELLGFLDADNPFDLNQILNMLGYFGEFDMVIVTKFKKLSKYQTSFTRRFFSISGAIFFRFLFGLNFKDTQAGAKFMKRELWRKLKKPFVSKGFEFDMELLYKASKKNAKIKEYYIPQRETDFSTVKARILPGMLYRLLKLRLLK